MRPSVRGPPAFRGVLESGAGHRIDFVRARPARHTPQYRARLYRDGLCRSRELPLLDEEMAADARYCGECRAVRARTKSIR